MVSDEVFVEIGVVVVAGNYSLQEDEDQLIEIAERNLKTARKGLDHFQDELGVVGENDGEVVCLVLKSLLYFLLLSNDWESGVLVIDQFLSHNTLVLVDSQVIESA